MAEGRGARNRRARIPLDAALEGNAIGTSVANPKFVSPWSEARIEFRIQSHTSNLLNLVWFTDLKFLNADAMEMTGTSNPPHECPDTTMSDNKASNAMWGGRFASGPAAIMEAINASISFDKKL